MSANGTPGDGAMLAAAVDYAARGFPVFPIFEMSDGQCSCLAGATCRDPGKHPRTTGGFKAATTDPEKIRAWWTRWPNANIGISTRRLFVLDSDPGHAGDETLAGLLAENGELPKTPMARSGGRGLHLYFKEPKEGARCSVGKIGPGLDVRAQGGYIIAPPSNHRSGGTYTWLDDLDKVDPAEPPAWLVDLARRPEAKIDDNPPPIKRSKSTGGYGRKILEGNCRVIAAAPERSRNNTLNREAFWIGRIVGNGDISEPDALSALHVAGEACGLGEDEVTTTVARALQAGITQPRRKPPRSARGPRGTRAPDADGAPPPDAENAAPAPISPSGARRTPATARSTSDASPATSVSSPGGTAGSPGMRRAGTSRPARAKPSSSRSALRWSSAGSKRPATGARRC